MKWFLIVLLLLVGFFYFFPENSSRPEQKQEQIKDGNLQKEASASQGIMSLIGKSAEEVKKQFGEPVRIDYSAYDYKWWIYNHQPQTYVQIGILKNRVVTVYVCGEKVNVKPFQINQPIKDIFNKIPIDSSIPVSLENGTYRFELSEEDLTFQPLVKLGDVYAQIYVDRFTGRVSSVRFMDAETLIKMRPYELVYRGKLLAPKLLSVKEQKKVELANAKQILDITNVVRQRHGVEMVRWDEKTSKAAYEHSKDMKENQFFSHESPLHGDLKDRLVSSGVNFQIAGENIAAQYVDGAAAVEGWLNSESHRETLLNEQFTHLGVGVFDKYYTQNFIKPQ
ncbi:CAP domain-containing protein [Paranoxybacillus vitaminiphilus]|nr:CAP domain-containing protein [Anoxybacillus vitaminiphilus]